VSSNAGSTVADIVAQDQSGLLADWLREQTATGIGRDDLISRPELEQQSRAFLTGFADAWRSGAYSAAAPAWAALHGHLANLARDRATRGYGAAEIAGFVLSFKRPLFSRLRRALSGSSDAFADELELATTVIDELGLYTADAFQKSREEVIGRQQQELLELSTPVVKLWDGILALPMIGTLDSGRTQVVMESLLQRIIDSEAEIAILDITGVPTVDTLVAQHLIKTVTAARLMGADCIISGIRPQIAQTIVHLGVDLRGIITKASLADAFAVALQRRGLKVQKALPGRTAGSESGNGA
jgi:rsbT co-antagonist protein RsbR